MQTRRNLRVRYPGGWRSLWGAGAYVAAYALAYAAVGPRLEAAFGRVVVERRFAGAVPLTEVVDPATVPAWKVVGDFLYGGHLVRAGVSLPDGGVANLLLATGGPYLALLAVPPLLLVAAGVAVTWGATSTADLRFDHWEHWRRYAANGALTVTFGYLPLALLGAYLFTFDATGPATFTVNLLDAWVLAGLVYPFVFGGLGGALVCLVGRR